LQKPIALYLAGTSTRKKHYFISECSMFVGYTLLIIIEKNYVSNALVVTVPDLGPHLGPIGPITPPVDTHSIMTFTAIPYAR
jgi:hypothetical protein